MLKLVLAISTGVLLPISALAAPSDSVSSDGSILVPQAEMSTAASTAGAFKGVTGIAHPEMDGADMTPLTTMEIARLNKLKSPKFSLIPESVIGVDTRTKVDPYDAAVSSYPARATAMISFKQGSSSYLCTGWMISPNTIATAGHCVHSGGSSGVWSSSVVVYPGYGKTNSPVAPYGSCTAKRLYSVSAWIASANSEYDYGAIKLNCTVGNTVGWFGLKSNQGVGTPTIITGYPGDKPSVDQWTSSDVVRSVPNVRKLYYMNDTYGGMSGSPIWYDDGTNGAPWAIGIHAYGGSVSSGTRIETTVFNNLVTWKNAL